MVEKQKTLMSVDFSGLINIPNRIKGGKTLKCHTDDNVKDYDANQMKEKFYLKENKQLKEIIVVKERLDPEEFFNEDIARFCIREKSKNKRLITWTAVIIMVSALISSYLIIALTGLGYMNLPDKLTYCMGASTIASLISTAALVVQGLFPPDDPNAV
jgi:hypothetical protein